MATINKNTVRLWQYQNFVLNKTRAIGFSYPAWDVNYRVTLKLELPCLVLIDDQYQYLNRLETETKSRNILFLQVILPKWRVRG